MTDLIAQATAIANERPRCRSRQDRELLDAQAEHRAFRREVARVEAQGEAGRFTADQIVRQRQLLARAQARQPKRVGEEWGK